MGQGGGDHPEERQVQGHALPLPPHPRDRSRGDPEHLRRRLRPVRAGSRAGTRFAGGARPRDRRGPHLYRQTRQGAEARRRAGRSRRCHRGGLGPRGPERRAEGAVPAARARALAPRPDARRVPGRERRRAIRRSPGRTDVPGAGSGEVTDQLWAPWRMELIARSGAETGCIFCDLPRAGNDRENLILGRTPHTFAILNRFPYNNGHLMVVPRSHTADLVSLPREEHEELAEMVRVAMRLVGQAYRAPGYNLGMKLGPAAGAGIGEQLHWHVVPRWRG